MSNIRLTVKQLLNKLLIKATLSTDNQPIYGAEIKFYTGSDPLSLVYIGSSYTNEYGEASITTDGYDGMYIKAVFEGSDEYDPCEAMTQYRSGEQPPPPGEGGVTLDQLVMIMLLMLMTFGILIILLLLSR